MVQKQRRLGAFVAMGVIAASIPLIGLVSLLLRSRLNPHIENYPLHFVVFGIVGAVAFGLGYAAGEAADRHAEFRVLLLSLAFMATGGFLWLHALGTPSILFSEEHAGFGVGIAIGELLVGASLCGGVGVRRGPVPASPAHARSPAAAPRIVSMSSSSSMGMKLVSCILHHPSSAARTAGLTQAGFSFDCGPGNHSCMRSAPGRYWSIFRREQTLLPATVVACFVLLSEAMIGVAVTGERKWHASWWEWHGLIVTAYLIVGLAARLEWRDERFRRLYLPTTRERHQEISVLFADLVECSCFAERSSSGPRLRQYSICNWGIAAPLITRRFGGELEKFVGDGLMATFNNSGDQPDHARRAACARSYAPARGRPP